MDSEEGGKKVASRRDQEQNLMKRVLKDKRLEKLQVQVKNNQQKKKKNYQKKKLRKLLRGNVPVKEVYVEPYRVGNHTEAYQICADMLKKFDRDDLVKLWDLVKRRFSTTKPTNDKEKKLWVELKRLFEPDNDDILWKIQRYMHDL
ncbi:hypothetical protein Tco_0974978 [Tanacetum coccineum]|uniref:Uncharacterized protein n=1 Tax=Tanacetum coccineum TaxID=301880 RepID=A0ABQ5EDB2_9ASTR